MFKEFFLFEMKQWFKRPAVYIYFMIFFIITLLLGAVVGGLFSGTVSDTNTYMNSASVIAGILTSFNSDFLLGFITIIIMVAVISTAVYKDFQHNSHALFFTKPITKFGYLMGRFIANYLVAIVIMSGAVFGYMVATLLVPDTHNVLGPFNFFNFIQPFFIFTVPNTLLIGAIFFSLVTFTRNITTGYICSLVLVVLLGVARSITADIDNKTISALLEPFGGGALSVMTEYWTPEEQNRMLIPFSGVLLTNRIIWLSVAILITLITYYRFKFSQFTSPVALFGKKKKEETSISSKPIFSISDIPKASQNFSLSFQFFQLGFLTRFELSKMLKSFFFPIIVLLAILFTVITSQVSGLIYGTETYPVTYQMLQLGGAQFQLFMMILLVFYSGMIIWREKDNRVDEFVGTTPVRSWVLFCSKYLALMGLMIVMIIISMITCMSIQAYMGYTNFEVGLYLKELIGFKIISFMIICAMAVSVQVFVNNKYVGFFVTVLILLGLQLLYNAFEWRNPLFRFNSSGSTLPYSDMNGYGHTIGQYFIYKMYWVGFSIMLSIFAIAMWQRGKEKNYKARFAIAKMAVKPMRGWMVLGVVLFLGFGGYIYYNIKILNKFTTNKEQEKSTAEFEKKYKKYEKEPQPRVVESNLHVDIFPKELGTKLKGYFFLKNKNKVPVRTIFLNLPNIAEIKELKLQIPHKEFLTDKTNGFYGYQLNVPMQPGDSIKLNFELWYFEKGFSAGEPNTQVVYNGTFFNSGLLPSIGYNEQGELSDNATRKKYDLPKKPRMAPRTDTLARMNSYISKDADWIRFECIVSTEVGQTALAPGYLMKEWKEGDRHYFQYKMDCTILNFYAFLSASYEIKRDKWKSEKTGQEVNIEIYYQKGHEYNIDRMIKGIKKSLDYFTANFSPYQHRQVRILEFPRYATFAQSFPNTIPFSEGIGFIAKVNSEDPESVDYPFYVTAHEVAHQWWAHQVIGGDVQGSTVMSETMSQYSALMVMEKEYGQAQMKKFLKYEMDKYLQGRTQEDKKEVPLILVENQQYIHYRKGSVVMYALKDYIGEDSLNHALARYIKKVGFQEPPYTTSAEFLEEIRKSTPDSLQEVVTDLFERITLFENKVKTLSYKKEADGKFKVNLVVNAKKFQSDSIGKQKEIAINDWIDIGVFKAVEKDGKKEEKVLFMKKIKITKTEQSIELIVNEEPESAGIDPYNKLIDRSPNNNTRTFKGGDKPAGDDGGGVRIQVGNQEAN
jgi:ABC-2 type transport system permease protein